MGARGAIWLSLSLAACDPEMSGGPEFVFSEVTVASPGLTNQGAVEPLPSGLLGIPGSELQPNGLPTFNVIDVAAHDLDGDGFLDLAAISLDGTEGRLTLLFGKGDGTFSLPSVVILEGVPQALAVSDLDSGGGSDVVVECAMVSESGDAPEVWLFSSEHIDTIRKAAAGATVRISSLTRLAPPLDALASTGRYRVTLSAPKTGLSLGSALDTRFAVDAEATVFAVSNRSRSGARIPVEIAGVVRLTIDPSILPSRLAIGPSVGANATPDLYVTMPGGIAIFDSEDDGARAASSLTASNAGGIMVSDVSGDRAPDAISLNSNSGSVTTFLADASGIAHFARSIDSPVGLNPVAFSLMSFNLGASTPDLLVANGAVIGPTTATQGRLTILSGDGSGRFTAARVLIRSGAKSVPVDDPVALAVGKFDTRSMTDDIVWAERTNPVQALPGGLVLVTAANDYLVPSPVTIPDAGIDMAGDDGGILDASTPPDLVTPPDFAAPPSNDRYIFYMVVGAPNTLGTKATNDSNCTTTANGAGLAGSYVALLSYGAGNAPADYVTLGTGNVILQTGTVVSTAANFFTATHMSGINRTASGGTVTSIGWIWTGFTPTGTHSTNGNCSNWTAATGFTRPGAPFSADFNWAESSDPSNCGSGAGRGVYCLQQ